jgi:hypothetical protein
MVGTWPCKVSFKIYINGWRVSDPVGQDMGKTTAPELEVRKDPKRARVVLSKGSEVVGLGYSRVIGVAAKVAREKILITMAGLTGFAIQSSITRAGLNRLAKTTT